MLGQVFGLHGLEGAGADMQRDTGALHAAGVELGQQRMVEMQCRGRGRYGSWHTCEYGLVALFVFGRVGVGDRAVLMAPQVMRQGHVAVFFHQRIGVVAAVVGQDKTTPVASRL